MKSEVNPLVSIVVITYNSSATVLETLESIKKQTYQNMELIVSDDCSTDNTQSVVRHWLDNKENTLPFKRVVFTSTPKNGGPAINCNHGIKNSKGEWVKLIAADDILLPDCINKNVNYIIRHEDVQIVFSKTVCFRDNGDVSQLPVITNWNFWKLTNKQKYFLLLLNNQITAPSQFMLRSSWKRLNGFDENIPFVEDWPFWIKAFKEGIVFGFFDEPTIKYRIYESLSHNRMPSKRFLDSLKQAKGYAHKCQYEVSPLFRFYSFVEDNIHSYIFKRIFHVWNPYYWYIRKIYSSMKS